MNKKNLVVITAILGVIGFVSTILITKTNSQTKESSKEELPTFIELNKYTDRQRKHSKLYNRPESKSLINENKSIGVVIGRQFIKNESFVIPQQSSFFANLTCKADVVVQGKVKSKSSQLSEDNASVFTDYEVEINSVLQDNLAVVKPNKVIVVTRSGGKVVLNGNQIEVINKSYKMLKIGDEYVLFLKYLSDSDSFAASSDEGTFEIKDNKFIRYKDNNDIVYQNEDNTLNGLIDLITAINSQCSEK